MPTRRKPSQTRKQFYNSIAWKKTRQAFMQHTGGLCARCRERGFYRAGVIVHHKQKLTDDNFNNPEIALNFDNLECLCIECHNKDEYNDHGFHQKRRYLICDDGTVEQVKQRCDTPL